MADPDADAARLDTAWRDCYLDPTRAGAAGRALAEGGGVLAAWGWLHVALAESRVGDPSVARHALDAALDGFERAGDRRGRLLAAEVLAILRRRSGDLETAAAILAGLDGADTSVYTPLDQFIAHNSRALTRKLAGQPDEALRHYYVALDAAEASGNEGARVTALLNLASLHHDLYNLDDARALTERALDAARAAGAQHIVAITMENLVVTHWSSGDLLRAREVTEALIAHLGSTLGTECPTRSTAIALGHLASGRFDEAETWLGPDFAGECTDLDLATLWTWVRARCALARGDATIARRIAERTMQAHRDVGLADSPFNLMELHRVLADACEQLGDTPSALGHMRRAHDLYVELVGRSARARRVALQIGFELDRAQRERDHAVDSHRAAEADRRSLAELNAALQGQIAANEALQAQLREQALRDPLTGLHNRRYLFEVAPAMLERARREDSALAVVLLDLDHFKLLNDTYGHHAGDLTLQRFATLLQQTMRRSDVVCRHGGEEFVALLPSMNGAGAATLLDRMLQAYQAEGVTIGKRRTPRGSFSAGVALFPRHGSTLEQLLSSADRALYRAKQQGRARVELAATAGLSAPA